jgi:hypothetical protein
VWLGGLVLLVLAACAFLWQRKAAARLRAMVVAETVGCADLAALRDAAAQAAGPGVFSHMCEIVGAAEAGEHGLLTAELSKVECVWHRQVVRRRYEKVQTDSKGNRSRSTTTETVHEASSSSPFHVRDASGSVLVDPGKVDIDAAERVVDRFEDRRTAAGQPAPAFEFTISLFGLNLSGGGHGDGTIGYEYKEWVVRPGQRLYVLGEASDRTGRLVVGEPANGHFVLSTRSEEELSGRTRREQMISAAAAAVAGVAGVVLLVLGVLG